MRGIKERIERICIICGKRMNVIRYTDKTYRNGHYFGKIPLYSQKELARMRRSGTHKSKISDDWEVDVYNYDPKPYAYSENWECPSCYWHPKSLINPLRKDAVRHTMKRVRTTRRKT